MIEFLRGVYKWYNKNMRDLPWRNETDPYKIWISEIILQQTRVEQGIKYYHKLTEAFPTVNHLADADEDTVLKLWQGLGYYSRARNMHAAARSISNDYKGKFPSSFQDLLRLKGIGPYTAAAVSSIAFGLPYPVLDGNVYRVLARYFGIHHAVHSSKANKVFQETAEQLMDSSRPGFHNQALMEFGALHCTPRNPGCISCPVAASCHAYNNNEVSMLPLKMKKQKSRNRYFCYYLIQSGDNTWIEKRTAGDIWQNLYQLPLKETTNEMSEEEIVLHHPSFLKGKDLHIKSISNAVKHVLTHQIIIARIIHLETSNEFEMPEPYIRIPIAHLDKYAMPVLVDNLIIRTNCL